MRRTYFLVTRPIAAAMVFFFLFSTAVPVYAEAPVQPEQGQAVESTGSQASSNASAASQDNPGSSQGPADPQTDLPAQDEHAPDAVPAPDPESKGKGNNPKDGDAETQSAMAGNQESQSKSVVSNSTIKQLVPEADLASGALSYAFPLTVPPGRNGLTPSVFLAYNSQNNSEGSIVGYGWSVDIPSIERSNKTGTEKLYTDNYFTSSLSGELALVSGTNYRAKVEHGEFLDYTLSSNAWTVKDKKGTIYKFGTAAASRQDNPSDATKVYKWMLDEVRDTNGNYIKYEYYKNGGQIYPDTITYTGNATTDGPFTVTFTREIRTDVSKSYHPAFLVTTSYRISEIQAKVSGTWVRKYALAYTTGDNGYRSLLSSITESGQKEDGTGSITKPAVSFQYQTATASWTTDTSTYTAPAAFQNDWQQMLDINGDAWVDIIESFYDPNFDPVNPSRQTVYLNNADGTWSSNSGYQPPAGVYFQKFENRGGTSSVWDQGVRLTDVDGDQLPDIIEKRDGTNGAASSYKNTGSAWQSRTPWTPTIPFTSTNDIHDYGAHTVDLNGDGFSDIIRNQGNNEGEQVNTGSGFASSTTLWTTPVDITYPHFRIIDVNGDKLPDVLESQVVSGPTHVGHAYLNKGDGTWQQDDTWAPPMQLVDNTNQYDFGVRFVDINGDQLVDAIIDPVNENAPDRVTYLNTGYGWAANSGWNLPVNANSLKNGDVRLTDINADGLLDFFSVNASGVEEAKVRNGVIPDLLKKVTYATAGYTDIAYKSSAQYKSGSTLLNPNMPMALSTVYTVTHNDGLGLSSAYTYTYEGGKYYFNTALDRKFAGFAKVTRADSAGNKSVTYYHQGDSTNSTLGEYSDSGPKIGRVYRTEQLDSSGNKYHVTINKWDLYNQATGRDFVKLVQTIDFTYDGNTSHKDIATAFTYDNSTGNVTQKVEWGEVTGTDSGTFTDTGSDKFTTDIAYASNATAYIYVPKTETVTDQSANKVRESKYYYDGQAHGTVNVGNLTKEEKWKTGTTYINTQKTYNTTYGIVTVDTDARGKTTSYSYDSYNLYPATVTNALSQATSYTYDYSLGKPKQVTDPNTRVFQTVYDGLDRVVEEKQPDLTTPSTLVTKTAYTYSNETVGQKIQETKYLDDSTTVDVYTYTDGLDRPIQMRQEMEDTNTFAVTDTIYNNVEQVYKQSLPYSSTGTSRTTATTTSDLLSVNSYDSMLRVTSVVNAVGTTSTAYDDWKVTITDPRSKTKDLYKDAHGNLVRVDEHNGASTYTTLYEYNGNGNLTKITDALSNVRNFTYDGLGRRLTAQDLHASSDTTYGSWTYAYDDNGNLTQIVDPKSQTVNYTYDDVSRPLTEDYTGSAGTEVTNTYDSGTDGVGHLTSVTAPGANTTYAYNALGLVKTETKTINGTSYQTDYTFDRQGNTLTITNPDGSIAKYTYNTAGQLETVQRKEATDGSYTNVVTDFDYGPHGKVTYQANQNGTSTTNTYDATKLYRLSAKVTTNAGATKFQDLAYTYDANSNITRIVDASNTNSSKTVDYTYDDLNRLTAAAATSVASGQGAYSHTYAYDAIGNITSKSDVGSYTYAGNTGSNYANPHAATAIANNVLAYDNNGNLLTTTTTNTSTIAVDATTTSISNGYNGGPTTKTWTHTTGSGSNRLLVLSADIWQDVGGTGTITSAYYNGTAMTKANSVRSGGMSSEIWYVVNPPSGANTVSVTVTGATDAIKLAATTYTGVDQTTPLVASTTATGTSGNPSISRTTTVDNSLLHATLSRFSTTAASTNRTSLYNNATGSTLGAASYQVTTTAGSYSDTYTGSSNSDWSMVAAEFRPASSQAVVTNTWNYKNQLAQTVTPSVTATYAYDHTGQRVKYANGTTTTYYPSKFYNTNGTTATKHIFTPDGSTMLTTVETILGTTSTPTVDATSTSISSGYNGGPATKTWSHTTSSGSNRILILTADIWQDVGGTGTITSASYNGTALTKVTNTRSGGMASEIWYLVNPPSGTNTMSVTVTGATDAIKLAASTFTNVVQSSPVDVSNTATGSTGNPSVSATTTTANDLVVATLSRFSTTAATSNRTSLYNNATGSILGASSYQVAASSGSASDTYTGSTNNDWSMVMAAFKPYTTSPTTTVKYIHTDHLTGSSVVSDSSGAQIELLDYFPYGNTRIDSGSYNEQRKFASMEADSDTGLSYANARYYNPNFGRFISEDPAFWDDSHLAIQLVDPQSWSSYAYARNNPLKLVDPDGQFWKEVWAFSQGAGNAIISNNAFGLGRQTSNDQNFNAGQTVGDAISLVQGSFETAVGIVGVVGSSTGGLVLALPTGGLSVGGGVVGVEASAGLVAHGSTVVQQSSNNLKTRSGFSQADKKQIQTENKVQNSGTEKCAKCGVDVQPGKRLNRGESVPSNRREHDHVVPKAQGGPNDPSNGQLLCHDCHVEKTRTDNRVTRFLKGLFTK